MREDEMEALYQIGWLEGAADIRARAATPAPRDARQRRDIVALEDLRAEGEGGERFKRRGGQRAEARARAPEREPAEGRKQRLVCGLRRREGGWHAPPGEQHRERTGRPAERCSEYCPSSTTRSRAGTGPSSLPDRRDRRASSVMSIDTSRSNDRSESLPASSPGTAPSARVAPDGRDPGRTRRLVPPARAPTPEPGRAPRLSTRRRGRSRGDRHATAGLRRCEPRRHHPVAIEGLEVREEQSVRRAATGLPGSVPGAEQQAVGAYGRSARGSRN